MAEPTVVTREMLEPILRKTAKGEFAMARSAVLDTAFHAEQFLTDVVAAYLGRRVKDVAYLAGSVIGPQSVNQRLRYLDEIMSDEGWHDDFPFVLPVLRKLFEVRNSLAHSYGEFGLPDRDGDDWVFSRHTQRRGKYTQFDVSLKRVRGVMRSAHHVIYHDLEVLWVRSIPEQYWRAADIWA
ncbi:hypothetical protein ACX27O_24965 [Micromonospora sp. SD19]